MTVCLPVYMTVCLPVYLKVSTCPYIVGLLYDVKFKKRNIDILFFHDCVSTCLYDCVSTCLSQSVYMSIYCGTFE